MRGDDNSKAAEALNSIIAVLSPLDEDMRVRVMSAARIFFGSSPVIEGPALPRTEPGLRNLNFSKDGSQSPKDFIYEKQPKTDVERVACLAYYLAHYRGTPHFKTIDLGKLNTEAAQPKFSNAANAANNAVKMGYLVQGPKGQRQLSAAGERFIQALPDRNAAREAMIAARPRRKLKKAR